MCLRRWRRPHVAWHTQPFVKVGGDSGDTVAQRGPRPREGRSGGARLSEFHVREREGMSYMLATRRSRETYNGGPGNAFTRGTYPCSSYIAICSLGALKAWTGAVRFASDLYLHHKPTSLVNQLATSVLAGYQLVHATRAQPGWLARWLQAG